MASKSFSLYVDAMFGKLGHFLRILGFDTEIADPKLKDLEILDHVLLTNRLLITRDRLFYEITLKKLVERKFSPQMVLFLPSQILEKQIVSVLQHIGVNPRNLLWTDDHNLPFQPRCSLCNSNLNIVKKTDISSHISAGTAATFDHFWQCANSDCQKIYWRGRHWDDIKNLLENVILLVDHP